MRIVVCTLLCSLSLAAWAEDDCNLAINNFAGGNYAWTMGMGYGARREAKEYVYVRPGPLTCRSLQINPQDFVEARWLYVVQLRRGRWDGGKTFRFAPTGPFHNADLNGDGFINTIDFAFIRQQFYIPFCDKARCSGDLNGDGVVNATDLGLLKTVFLDLRKKVDR